MLIYILNDYRGFLLEKELNGANPYFKKSMQGQDFN